MRGNNIIKMVINYPDSNYIIKRRKLLGENKLNIGFKLFRLIYD